jgi:hypothetical protein
MEQFEYGTTFAGYFGGYKRAFSALSEKSTGTSIFS